ncbi:MAG TPA: hypothetical protein VK013_15720 [Myxococcaceae bacterium]|nr:hypothetical protein [Myxococcaceae bacterium]
MERSPASEDLPIAPPPEETGLVFRGASWAWRHRLLLPIAWLTLGVVLLGCFAAWRQGESVPPIVAAVVGSLSVVVAGWALARRQSNRRWIVRLSETGLRLTTDGREQTLPFSALRAFSVDSKRVSFGKLAESVHRRVHLETEAGAQVISARLEHPDEVLAMERLLEGLTAGSVMSARERMARGGRIEGAGWIADARGISSTTRTGRAQQVPWQDVTHHENLGAAFLFWARDAVRPWLRVARSSRNAWVLPALIGPPASSQPVGATYGRLLWEFRANRAPTVTGIIILAGGLMAFAWQAWVGESPWGGLMLSAVGAGLAYAGWRAEVRTAFHERGVIGSRGGQKQEVTYASAAGFAYQRHVQSEGGMHIGVKGALSIIPSDGSAPVTALTDTDRMDEDEPIIVLRERLAGVWQPRLIEQLENSGSVAWAPGVRLRRDGVQLDAAKGGAHLVPWSRIRAHWGDRFERSLVLLDASAETGRPAEARVVAEIDTGEPGFHAGKRLFEDLREAAPDRVDGND